MVLRRVCKARLRNQCDLSAQPRRPPFDGASNYTVHFDKGQTPPAEAFWSIALYDNDGFQVANQLPYNLTMRIYAPEADALTGKWNPLPVMKAQTVPAAAQ
jgi:hypothetical protein